ncbi:MAG: Ig-like domain-containing protein [Flavobacteriaceae bacterium]|nr:Ig-like domain-containing protein [Flavobacteriaceae bacterium]
MSIFVAMMHRIFYFAHLFFVTLTFVNCAKRGNPSGGSKDSIPPIIVKYNPENYSINFTDDEIRIYFDEYIKLIDINKELIISPPLKYQPEITPLNTGKFIKIIIKDTLKKNTTYSFNFGKSVVDYTEGNIFKYLKYIFSTGSFIDSLKLKGTVKDALLLNSEGTTTVMLYEVNEAFNDSIIYFEKPTYITNTKEESQEFELTNLKEGTYFLIALKDKTNDYIFQPNYDKIGFLEGLITLPSDSSFTINIFKETENYTIKKPKHEGKNHIIFGYNGDAKDLKIELKSSVPKNFESTTYIDSKSDTLHYWFKPFVENDSLIFTVKNKNYVDTLVTRMRDLYADTLLVKPINSGVLTPRDTLKFSATTPLILFDPEKATIINQDSVEIPFKGVIDDRFNTAVLNFDIKIPESYTIQLLPGAFIDFFEQTNDTINVRVRTKENSDYGTLRLILSEPKQLPLIVQLVNTKYKVIQERYYTNDETILFEYIIPGEYYIRVIYDENKNKDWDTGNYLKKIQPETAIYYPKKIEIRPNWSLVETFKLD